MTTLCVPHTPIVPPLGGEPALLADGLPGPRDALDMS
jgi:hypothetical protein